MYGEDRALSSLFDNLNEISAQAITGDRTGGGKGGGADLFEQDPMETNRFVEMNLNPYLTDNVHSFKGGGRMHGPYHYQEGGIVEDIVPNLRRTLFTANEKEAFEQARRAQQPLSYRFQDLEGRMTNQEYKEWRMANPPIKIPKKGYNPGDIAATSPLPIPQFQEGGIGPEDISDEIRQNLQQGGRKEIIEDPFPRAPERAMFAAHEGEAFAESMRRQRPEEYRDEFYRERGYPLSSYGHPSRDPYRDSHAEEYAEYVSGLREEYSDEYYNKYNTGGEFKKGGVSDMGGPPLSLYEKAMSLPFNQPLRETDVNYADPYRHLRGSDFPYSHLLPKPLQKGPEPSFKSFWFPREWIELMNQKQGSNPIQKYNTGGMYEQKANEMIAVNQLANLLGGMGDNQQQQEQPMVAPAMAKKGMKMPKRYTQGGRF